MNQAGHNARRALLSDWKMFHDSHETVLATGRQKVRNAIVAGKHLRRIRDYYRTHSGGFRAACEKEGVATRTAYRYLLLSELGEDVCQIGTPTGLGEAVAACEDLRDQRAAEKAKEQRARQLHKAQEARQRAAAADSEESRAEAQGEAHVAQEAAEWAQVRAERAEAAIDIRRARRERGVPAAVGRNAHEAGGEIEWYTPSALVELVRSAMGGPVDTDPASCETAQGWIQAARWFGEEEDGLAQEWAGRTWINPPFKPAVIKQFAAKLLGELDAGRVTHCCWLSPTNNADTAAMQALMARASAVCLLAGRVKFIAGDDGREQGTAWATMVLYFGNRPERFMEVFDTQGVCWRRGVG